MKSKKYDIVLLTEAKYINPQTIDWYTDQVLTEDSLVQTALEDLGLSVIKKDWADNNFDWTETHFAMFRTTWNYFNRFDEFNSWLNHVASKIKLINSFDLIQWNMDKHYLQDLENNGIRIVPTNYYESGTQLDLFDELKKQNWTEAVVKPVVSGAARHTYKVSTSRYQEVEKTLNSLLKVEAMMIQPFQNSIESDGEVSHIVIHGKHTHSVLKKAKEGDFRVQDDWGGTVHNYNPSKEEIQFAEEAVRACSTLPYYARVDVLKDNEGQLAICELELVEPELWFRKNPDAAKKLAASIKKLF